MSRIVANQFKNKLKLKFVFELVRDNSRRRKYDILVKLGELDDNDAGAYIWKCLETDLKCAWSVDILSFLGWRTPEFRSTSTPRTKG